MNSKVRHIIYGIISFVLSFVLFLISFAIVLQSTILNPSYIMDNMNTSNYFVDKRDEIKESLVNLGYASGLDEKFLFFGIMAAYHRTVRAWGFCAVMGSVERRN